jgi:hypothetical protein
MTACPLKSALLSPLGTIKTVPFAEKLIPFAAPVPVQFTCNPRVPLTSASFTPVGLSCSVKIGLPRIEAGFVVCEVDEVLFSPCANAVCI